MTDALRRKLDFVVEIDKLKGIFRQTLLTDGSRHENSAEHSWHLAIMALVLSDYAKEKNIDLLRVITMVLIHDLVEIDAGDTYCYDEEAKAGQNDREEKAAARIFGLLPSGQAEEFIQVWREFDARKTPEACFAAALDRLQPIMHNYLTNGVMWQHHGIRKGQVVERNSPMKDGAPELWRYATALIDDAVNKEMLMP